MNSDKQGRGDDSAGDKKGDRRAHKKEDRKKHDRKKRGMKPRSQRNRKRPRSEKHSNDNLVIDCSYVPLKLDGEKAPTAPDWLRVVKPYPYTFASHAKARWLGRTILDIYTTEFGSYPASYYETAIAQGRILVSDRKVDASYKIVGSDVLSHTVHRHEPGVAVATDQSPYVVVKAETDLILAVDKPSTLPVHPCGGYNENSLMNLLEPAYGKLFTIHRLDRLTSGLVVLAKSSEQAKIWGKAIQERDACEKLYLARVRGRFPRNCPTSLTKLTTKANAPLPVYGEWSHKKAKCANGSTDDEEAISRERNAYGYWISNAAGNPAGYEDISLDSFSESEHPVDEWLQYLKILQEKPLHTTESDLQWLHLACPVRIEQQKNGVCVSGTFDALESSLYLKTVKPAQTAFAVIRYDEETDSTVVLCRPGTGRTHQIRLALQHLGHPIANDPNYGGSMWCANKKGEIICGKAQTLLDAMDKTNTEEIERANGVEKSTDEKPLSLIISDVPATSGEVERMVDLDRQEEEPFDQFIHRTCVWCARCRGKDRTRLEFLVRSSGIWLHALQYTICVDGREPISFRTDPPKWSLPFPS